MCIFCLKRLVPASFYSFESKVLEGPKGHLGFKNSKSSRLDRLSSYLVFSHGFRLHSFQIWIGVELRKRNDQLDRQKLLKMQPGLHLCVLLSGAADIADSISRWNASPLILKGDAKLLCTNHLHKN